MNTIYAFALVSTLVIKADVKAEIIEGDIEYKAVRRILGDVYFYSGWKAVKKLK